ncbi:hypothetical protein KSP39_PZI005291 [Platanthera zijinensis]|uniref:Retrotransposon gag domain-containing protein n=1 Tax=Platanthera zijinensis TaxID=2320716 RepID=A0AAP0GAJ0_9ASPA
MTRSRPRGLLRARPPARRGLARAACSGRDRRPGEVSPARPAPGETAGQARSRPRGLLRARPPARRGLARAACSGRDRRPGEVSPARPVPGPFVGREEFMASIEGIMGMLRSIAPRADSLTPTPQRLAPRGLGELTQSGLGEMAPRGQGEITPAGGEASVPDRRPGKERMVEGVERDLPGRELFPSPARASPPGEQVARVEVARAPLRGSPFSELIISAPVPEGFREPDMVYYTGKDDPVQHLQWFEDAVSIRPMTDAFKCRLFAITLKEKARDWFHQLPPRSIFGFEDLSRSFQLRFSTSKKRKKGPESLFLLKQRAEESLAHYVDRFQEEVLDIQEVPGYALQMAFTVGLREGFFKMSLTRKAPLSFEELMERAAEEIAMEAANPAFVKKLAKLTEVESKEQGGSRHHEGRRREEHRAQGFQRQEGLEPGWRQQGGPAHGPGRALIQDGGNHHGGQGRFNFQRQAPRQLLPPPQQAMVIGRRDRRNRKGRGGGRVELPYCDFHQLEGHATATCPEFLEVRGRELQPSSSRSGLKFYPKEGLGQRHFQEGVRGMKVEPRRIVASDGPLFGFSGERKEVEGGVGLQVKLGGTSRNCRFVIVDAPSSYNAIFGRPLISAFRCVPSSFHQCLKFNSDGIQVRIKGDSRMARQCYVTAVNTISWLAKAEEMEKIMESLSRVEVASGMEPDGNH